MKRRGGVGRSWVAGSALVVVVILAGALLARAWRPGAEPTWEEISQELAAERWPAAEAKLAVWIRSHPRSGQATLLLADTRLRQGKYAAAMEILERVREPERFWPEAQAMIGGILMEERRAAEAEACFRRAISRGSRALEPRRRLVYLLSLQGRSAEARRMLWEIHDIVDDPRVLVDLVLELVKLREDIRGLGPELEEYLKVTPQDAFLRRAWGMTLLYQGRAAEALPHLESAASALENDAEGRFALAECRLQLGKPLSPPDALGPPPEDALDQSQWWLFRGRLAESLGQNNETEEAYRAALAHNAENREAMYRLGQLLSRTGRARESDRWLSVYRESEQRVDAARREHSRLRREGFSDDPELFSRLGLLCQQAGMKAEALAWFRHALKLDPGRASLRQSVSDLEAAGDLTRVALAWPRLRTGSEAPGNGTSTGSPSELGRVDDQIPAPIFRDVTRESGIDYVYDCGARGDLFLTDTMGGGLGLIDYDGDGLLDLYFVNGASVPYDEKNPPRPNRLFRNRGDGTFTDVTRSARVEGAGCGMGCVIGDYDNDGDEDLFVTGFGRTILYRNRGDGVFEDVTDAAGVQSRLWTTAAGFGDLDGDGDLDLVVATYVDIDPAETPSCKDHARHPIHCSPGRYAAQDDLLYRNEGNGRFTEVSKPSGFRAPQGRGLGLALLDFDADGKLDIYVANDATPDFLFRNLGGWKFQDVAAEAGLATNGSGLATASMGVVADDLDGDGLQDLFVTNFLNEPNSLFRNVGAGLFMDATLAAGLDASSRSRTGFGCAALDADNDGILDLFVANGHVDDQPWANSPMAQVPHFFRGLGGGRFALVGSRPGDYFARAWVGRGAAAGDLDNDGRVDLVVVHRDAPAVILRNETPGGHSLGVQLRGGPSPRTPVGARVTCRIGQRSMVRWLSSGPGYLSAHDQRLWFGLGKAEFVDRLDIAWPSGTSQSFRHLPADQLIEVVEGSHSPRSVRRWAHRP